MIDILFIIVGQTNAGKTTLQKQLIKLTGIKPLITYTNRPKREGEVDGKDYHFISTKEIQNPVYVNKRYFNTAYTKEPFIYGIHYDDLKDATDKLAILDPSGVNHLSKYMDEDKFKVMYLDIPEKTIRERANLRGDSEEEITRRLEEDREDFENIKESCDLILTPLSGDITNIAYKFVEGSREDV